MSGVGDLTELALERATTFRGEVALPGSKSIANRALLLGALAEGKTRLANVPDSDDVEILLGVLPGLGVRTTARRPGGPSAGEDFPGRIVEVAGCGGPFRVDQAELMLGNAGTALRPLTAVLAASSGRFRIDGDEHMRRRPIGDLVSGLGSLGVDITGSGTDGGYPPLQLNANGLKAGRVALSGRVSSQYISALLIAAPLATADQGDAFVIDVTDEPVSKPYIDLTITMMEQFGVRVEREGYRHFRVPLPQRYRSPGTYRIEGDASAATYFLAAGALPGCGPIRVTGLTRPSLQGDLNFAELLAGLGARVRYSGDNKAGTDSTGSGGWVETHGVSGPMLAPDLDMNAMPDAAMTLAVLALFLQGTTHIRNIANLRVKESERIRGLRTELEKLGAAVVEEEDALHITPPAGALTPARIATYNDHRMAMAFSLASFGTRLEIEDPGCVSKTYPDYFADFRRVCVVE